jgi:hypothetical protein
VRGGAAQQDPAERTSHIHLTQSHLHAAACSHSRSPVQNPWYPRLFESAMIVPLRFTILLPSLGVTTYDPDSSATEDIPDRELSETMLDSIRHRTDLLCKPFRDLAILAVLDS